MLGSATCGKGTGALALRKRFAKYQEKRKAAPWQWEYSRPPLPWDRVPFNLLILPGGCQQRRGPRNSNPIGCRFHCNTIPIRCSVIRTILKSNSDNYTGCAFQNCSAFDGKPWEGMGYDGMEKGLPRPKARKVRAICAELICSAAVANACKSLIILSSQGFVARFQRTFNLGSLHNQVTNFVSIV